MDFDADRTALDSEERGGGDGGEHDGLPDVRRAHTASELRMSGEGDEGDGVTIRGGWDIPEQDVSRGSPTLRGPIDQSRPMALKTVRATPTGRACSARTVLAVSV